MLERDTHARTQMDREAPRECDDDEAEDGGGDDTLKDTSETSSDASWDACARRADARVRACMVGAIFRNTSTATTEENICGSSCHDDHVCTDCDIPATTDATFAAAAAENDDEAIEDADAASQHDDMKRHFAEEGEEAPSSEETANCIEREMIVHLESVLSCERDARKDLERELAARDDALVQLEAKTRRLESEAISEARKLQSEVNRVETVTRQEENVTRLRLEAEHEVRVGRLATELDRVRGQLEARETELENERQKAKRASDELNRVREELIVKLNSESNAFMETISSINEAIAACGENLQPDHPPPIPRMSQSVPSHRDRASIGIAQTAPVPLLSSTKTANHVEPTSLSSRVGQRTNAHQPPRARFHMVHAQPQNRRMKTVSSQKGVVGYANIYAEERLAKRAIA